jgi:hypothetical protein
VSFAVGHNVPRGTRYAPTAPASIDSSVAVTNSVSVAVTDSSVAVTDSVFSTARRSLGHAPNCSEQLRRLSEVVLLLASR